MKEKEDYVLNGDMLIDLRSEEKRDEPFKFLHLTKEVENSNRDCIVTAETVEVSRVSQLRFAGPCENGTVRLTGRIDKNDSELTTDLLLSKLIR